MARLVKLLAFVFIASVVASCAADNATARHVAPAPAAYSDEPACQVKSVQKYPASYENIAMSPAAGLTAITRPDAKGVYQVYVGRQGSTDMSCISCAPQAGGPAPDRNKPMISWHPGGKWLVVGVEETMHDNMWMPAAWQRGLLQSGIWLNIWVTTPDGSRWKQITDFKKGKNGPSDGFVGVAFSPDGRRAVWAEIVDGNIFANHFGIWKLYMADVQADADGLPSFVNKRDITPAGAKWVEPGNFAPDNRHLLISSDLGMQDAQGQDQFALDVESGQVQDLNNSPMVWDEHGMYSPDGRKISFMSSYPYRAEPNNYKATSLKTEFMLMDADGGHIQQVTHFNEPGYPESQPKNTVAAVAQFIGDGSQLFGTVMSTDNSFGKTNWLITFAGRCGG